VNLYGRYFIGCLMQEPGRTLLVVLSLILAIATFSSVRLANELSLRSFESTSAYLKGRSDVTVHSLSGRIEASLPAFLKAVPGILAVSPRAERWGTIEMDEKVQLVQILALDILANQEFEYYSQLNSGSREDFFDLLAGKAFFASPDLLLKVAAQAFTPLTIEGESLSLNDYNLIKFDSAGQGTILIMDVEVYLDNFAFRQEIDSIDLLFDTEVSYDDLRNQIQSLLGSSFYLQSQDENADRLALLTEALRVNLHYMAAIALFVSVLVIYHVMSFLGMRRRSDFSLLRCLGATPLTIKKLIFFEAIILGLIGGSLGYLCGYYLAGLVSEDLTSTIRGLYANVVTHEVEFSWRTAVEALGLGVALTVVGALPIASEAAKVAPVQRNVLAGGNSELNYKRIAFFGVLCGSFILFCSYLLSDLSLVRNYRGLGLFLALTLSLGVLAFVPLIFTWVLKILRPSSRRVSLLLACDHLSSSFYRSIITVGSVALALGMFIGISTMIASFRGSVVQWIDQSSEGDLYISLPGPYQNRATEVLPPALLAYLQKSESVASGRLGVIESTRYKEEDIFVRSYKSLHEGLHTEECIPTANVSESFSQRFSVKEGDSIYIPHARELQTIKVSQIVSDYSAERGIIFLSPQCFRHLYSSFDPQTLSLVLGEGVSTDAFSQEIQTKFLQLPLHIRDSQGLRQEVVKTFDATFQITYALQTISLILVVFIILNTILILFHERRHEFATLRALGASITVLSRLAVIEACILTVVACFFALLLGITLSLFLIYVINLAYFGWSVMFVISWQLIFLTFALTIGFVAILTYFLARATLEKNMREALRYE